MNDRTNLLASVRRFLRKYHIEIGLLVAIATLTVAIAGL